MYVPLCRGYLRGRRAVRGGKEEGASEGGSEGGMSKVGRESRELGIGMARHVTSRHAMPSHATPRHATPGHVTSSHVMSHQLTLDTLGWVVIVVLFYTMFYHHTLR